MSFDWSNYNSLDTTEDIPLLISIRSVQLIETVMEYLTDRENWLAVDDATWDLIDNAIGQAYFAIEESRMVDATPVGMVAWFPIRAANIPTKWLKCDNAAYTQAAYPELYAVLQDFHFVDSGVNKFRTPALTAAFLWGATLDAHIGTVGGEVQHTLLTSELPAHHHDITHTHNIQTDSATGTSTNRVARGNSGTLNTQATISQSATNSGDTGSGTPFNMLPPYMRGYWLIKALP